MDKVSIKELEPEVYAQRCPVCNGFGTLKHGTLKCQGCEGKGYILVPTKTERRTDENKDNTY
jgi:DnaJ-class molecular chaperone